MPALLASTLARDHAREILALEADELTRLRTLYERARLEILGRLMDVPADTFTAQHLRSARTVVESGLRAMVTKVKTHHAELTPGLLKDSIAQTLDEVAVWEPKFRGGATGRIQLAALRNVAAPRGLLLSQFASSMDAYGSGLIRDLQFRLGVHLVKKSSWRDMAVDIAGRLHTHGIAGARWKAERIVRTELINATSTGHQAAIEAAAEEIPGLKRQWDATNDKRTCLICNGMNGQVRKIDEPFSHGGKTVMQPPAHPGCLPGSALVAPAGRITGQTERHFEGDLIVLRTAAGNRLACTPNHPVLTDRGWIPARLVDVGGHVVRCVSPQRLASPYEHAQHMPAAIEEIAGALRRSREMTAREVPVATEDFHGDGMGGQIAVVRTDRLLWGGLDTALAEHDAQASLDRRIVHAALLAGSGALAARLQARGLAAHGVVCRRHQASSTLWAFALHAQAIRLAAAAYIHAALFQAARGQASRDPEVAADRQNGFSALVPGHDLIDVDPGPIAANHDAGGDEMPSDRGGLGAELARELQHRFPGDIALDQVVGREIRSYSGHVYNLETSQGYYVADGIVVHNCRCRAVPYHDDWANDLAGPPKPETPPKSKPPPAKPARQPRGPTAAQRREKVLRREEAAIQRERIEHAVLVDRDGAVVFKKTDRHPKQVSFTTDETARFRGNTLTHNHPSGGSFSPQDIGMAMKWGLAEMRAIGSTGYLHRMRPKPDGVPWTLDAWERIVEIAFWAANQEVFTILSRRIAARKLDRAGANARHAHLVWKRVSRRVGLIYTRTRVK